MGPWFRAIPTNPSLGNIQIPLPIYRLVSVGGDTQLTVEPAVPDPDRQHR